MAISGPYQQQAKPSVQQGSSRMGFAKILFEKTGN